MEPWYDFDVRSESMGPISMGYNSDVIPLSDGLYSVGNPGKYIYFKNGYQEM